MTTPGLISPWFALRVKSNYEKSVAFRLRNMGYAEFLPLYRRLRRWPTGQRVVSLPLFPGYLFSSFDPEERQPILKIPGVLHIVSSQSIPVPVDSGELSAVRRVLESPQFSEPWPFLNVGDRVLLVRGPLAGIRGVLIRVEERSYRVIVSVALLQRSLAVEVDRDWIRIVQRSPFRLQSEAAVATRLVSQTMAI